jgi:hypothetical protein
MELQYHIYKSFFGSGWTIKDSSKSAVLYSMNAKHLYKHEDGGKRIVASMKHDTEEGYSIHLQDEDKRFALSSNLSGDSWKWNVSFEFEDQKFRWASSVSALLSQNGVKTVAQFVHNAQYSIANVGSLYVRVNSHKFAVILTTIFIAQRLLRGRESFTLVLSRLTEEIGDFAGAQRRLVENNYALSAAIVLGHSVTAEARAQSQSFNARVYKEPP